MKQHQDFKVVDAGLFIDHLDPFLGASPDGIAQCACCGRGVVEVKCPFCNDLPDDDKQFCMAVNGEGTWKLKKDHSYYYQVQLQLHMCDVAMLILLCGLRTEQLLSEYMKTKISLIVKLKMYDTFLYTGYFLK